MGVWQSFPKLRRACAVVEPLMTPPVTAPRGKILPEFTLPDINDSPMSLENCRGRTNLVVVFAGDRMDEIPVTVLVEELAARMEELQGEAAHVLIAVTSRPPAVPEGGQLAFPVLVDSGAHIHRTVGAIDAVGRAAPAVFITDRFREIYAAYLPGNGAALPTVEEILGWLVFINIQCPECGVSEWPM
jgi:peroxiredoxin